MTCYLTECRQSDALNADTIVILLERALTSGIGTVLRVQSVCIATVQGETKHSKDCLNASIILSESIQVLSIGYFLGLSYMFSLSVYSACTENPVYVLSERKLHGLFLIPTFM